MSHDRRVWVTGIGVTSALGPDRPSLAQGIFDGSSGIRELTLFPTAPYRSKLAGQAPDPERSSRRLCRADGHALQAAAEALRDADLPRPLLDHAAVLMGTGAGGAERTLSYVSRLEARGEHATPAAWLTTHQPANATDLVATEHGARGPRLSLMTACSSSAAAAGVGIDLIRSGRASTVLAGGTEALCQLTFGGFSALRAMDPDPCRPFHAARRGLSLGEGAAVLVLEQAEQARQRGARPYAELCGYGLSSDAHHLTAPAPDGRGAVAAMRAALGDAGLAPDQIQYINAHGTATPHNDPVELDAIRTVFGPHARSGQLAISSTKGATGHCLGAAGALELCICALALRQQQLPPTLRLDQPDPSCEGLTVVGQSSRNAALDGVLSNSFAFGGNNASVVLRRVA